MKQTILLVDDDEALRMTLRDRLRKEGYTVDCASDGDWIPEGNFAALRPDDPRHHAAPAATALTFVATSDLLG